MIEGVKITNLKIIDDERGEIRHFMRCDKPPFEKFGEVYFSQIYPNVVKAWHSHKIMTLNYVCVVGIVHVVLCDKRPESTTHGEVSVHVLADHGENHIMLTVPPGVWNGFRVRAGWADPAIISNCATHPHDPAEIERYPLEDVDYNWGPYRISG